MYRHFKRVSAVGSCTYIYFWKSEGLSNKNITASTISDNKLNPKISYLGTNTRLEFNESYLKQDKITYDHEKVVNIYIIYDISKNFNVSSYSTLENCLFGAFSLIKKS